MCCRLRTALYWLKKGLKHESEEEAHDHTPSEFRKKRERDCIFGDRQKKDLYLESHQKENRMLWTRITLFLRNVKNVALHLNTVLISLNIFLMKIYLLRAYRDLCQLHVFLKRVITEAWCKIEWNDCEMGKIFTNIIC